MPAATDKSTLKKRDFCRNINSDIYGFHLQESGRELVDFHPGTTIRIWHNHPATAFPPHRHMALENHMPVENHYPDIYDDLYQILVAMRNEYYSKNALAELTIYSLTELPRKTGERSSGACQSLLRRPSVQTRGIYSEIQSGHQVY